MSGFKVIGAERRVREDRRFVTGAGRYVADIELPNLVHTAIVPAVHASARILDIDVSAASALPGVHAIVTGADLAGDIEPLMNGLDTPNVRRYPLAVERVRYAGEWLAVVVADTRRLAEDAAELVKVSYARELSVIDAQTAYSDESPPVHPDHGSNVLLDRTFTWGSVDKDFDSASHTLSFQAKWGRSSTVPLETFGVVASWDAWREQLDVWASIQMPKFQDQIARALRLPGNGV